METNILILSVGTRNKIVQYFKKELEGTSKVFATDNSVYAPALYEADEYFIVPRIDDDKYLETILDICVENNIKGVLSLIDPELSILAKNRDKFLEIGTVPIVSNYDLVEKSFDKIEMFEFLKNNNIETVNSYSELNKFYKDLDNNIINFPIFVKPIDGSASININKVDNKEELELLFAEHDNLMIQEFMDGKELGADVYIDLITKEVVSIFVKEKLRMRAGETDKSISLNNKKIFSLIKDFVELSGYEGIIDIDIFEKNGVHYISEVNPRFGGGYLHAHEAGENIPKMIINNLGGLMNEESIGEYKDGTVMMKFSEVVYKGEVD